MIGWLRGVLVNRRAPVLVLDVNGVGYEITAPMTTIYALPAPGEILSTVVDEMLGACYAQLGDKDRRLTAARRVLDSNPLNTQARQLYAESLVAVGRLKEAIDEYDTIFRMLGKGKVPGRAAAASRAPARVAPDRAVGTKKMYLPLI